MSNYQPEQVTTEAGIVWLRDPATLPYVRERRDEWQPRRTGCPTWRAALGELVGYAELAPAAPRNDNGRFSRRVFYLLDHDRALAPQGPYRTGCPSEGVDPLTVAVGVPGVQNDRAWGGPLPRPRLPELPRVPEAPAAVAG